MSVVSAVFLAGLVCLALPLWLHRLKSHAREQHTFSSLYLMRASEVPVLMRRELQYLWLLGLRLLLLVAICLAFAEPLLELAGITGTSPQVRENRIIVLDTSLSMNSTVAGQHTFGAAKSIARELVQDLPVFARAALILVNDEIELRTGLIDDRVQLNSAIAASEASSARMIMDGLAGRIANVIETLEVSDERLVIHIISDFQQTAMPDQFNALIEGSVWPVVLHVAGDKTPDDIANWAVVALKNRQDRQTGSQYVDVTIAGFNTPATEIDVVLEQNGQVVGQRRVNVSAGGTTSVKFEVAAHVRGGTTWIARIDVEAKLDEDALIEDNERRLVRHEAGQLSLPVLVSGTSAQRPYVYLRSAIQAAASRFNPLALSVSAPQRETQLDHLVGANAAAPVVVLLDPGVLSESWRSKLNRYLESGGAVLMTAGPETRAAGRLPLLDAALAPGRFDQPGRGIIAADSSHPVLSNFAAWRDLTVFQTVKLAKPGVAEVILELDDGTPLLIESSVGSGRLMILMSALDSQWNSLVISPAFIDFIVNTLSYLADDLLPVDVLVGQAFALPAQSIQLFDVSGKRVLGLGDTVGRPTVRIDEPGVYQLRTPGSTRLLAVNTDVRESDLSPAAQEVLQRWQSATATDITSDINSTPLETSDQGSVDERRIVPLAYWLLVALLLLVIAEPLLANGAGFGPGNSGADARKRA